MSEHWWLTKRNGSIGIKETWLCIQEEKAKGKSKGYMKTSKQKEMNVHLNGTITEEVNIY